ncbi:MAG: methyltransferase family protein [Candidatus Nanopelagicales bacterium]
MGRGTLGWLLVLVQFALLIGLILLPWRDPSLLSLVLGAVLLLAGMAVFIAAVRALGSALTPTPVPIAGSSLRTGGLYRYVRHPIYSGVLLMVLGLLVAVGSWAGWAWGVLILVFFVVKSRWEDRLLAEAYGQEWATWSARTGAMVPRLRRER